MPSKKAKVNSSQSSSNKTQSSSGSTRIHPSPARKSNRLQKSSIQLPEFCPSVSPKKSGVRDRSANFDPRAIAVNPTRGAKSKSSPGSSPLGLTSEPKSKRLQNKSPEEKLSSMFTCTPVKEDANSSQEDSEKGALRSFRRQKSNSFQDDDNDRDSNSSQENRNTHQTPAIDKGRGKASDVFRTSPEKVQKDEMEKGTKFNPFKMFNVLKPREDVECESDSSQESRPMSPKREKKSAAEVFDYNSSQESKVPFLIPRR